MLENGELRIPVKITESDFGIRRVVLGVHGIGGSAMDDIQTAIAEEMEREIADIAEKAGAEV